MIEIEDKIDAFKVKKRVLSPYIVISPSRTRIGRQTAEAIADQVSKDLTPEIKNIVIDLTSGCELLPHGLQAFARILGPKKKGQNRIELVGGTEVRMLVRDQGLDRVFEWCPQHALLAENALNSEISTAFLNLAATTSAEVLQGIAGCKIALGDSINHPFHQPPSGVAVGATLLIRSRHIVGKLCLFFAEETYLSIASKFLKKDLVKGDPLLKDTAAELLNTIYGKMARTLSFTKGFHLSSTLPTMLSKVPNSSGVSSANQGAVTISLSSDHGELWISLVPGAKD